MGMEMDGNRKEGTMKDKGGWVEEEGKVVKE